MLPTPQNQSAQIRQKVGHYDIYVKIALSHLLAAFLYSSLKYCCQKSFSGSACGTLAM